jgi:phage terminase small subunit
MASMIERLPLPIPRAPKESHSGPVKRGAYSAAQQALRRRNKRIRRHLAKLYKACPHLTPADEHLARRWCQIDIMLAALDASIAEAGVTRVSNGDLYAKRAVDDFRKLSDSQLRIEMQLGITPASRAALRTLSRNDEVDIVAMMATAPEPTAAEPEAPGDPSAAED